MQDAALSSAWMVVGGQKCYQFWKWSIFNYAYNHYFFSAFNHITVQLRTVELLRISCFKFGLLLSNAESVIENFLYSETALQPFVIVCNKEFDANIETKNQDPSIFIKLQQDSINKNSSIFQNY